MSRTYQYILHSKSKYCSMKLLFSLLNFTCVCVWSGVMCVLGLDIKFLS